MPNIIAIDTGLQRLGYCQIYYNLEDSLIKIKEYGTFETKSKDSLGKRLQNIHEFIKGDLLFIPDSEGDYSPIDLLVYEYPNFTNKQSLILGSVIGVIELSFQDIKDFIGCVGNIKSISPTEVKKKIYGKGTASKNQVKLGVIKTLQQYDIELDLSKQLDDAIDAIAIALVTYQDLLNEYNNRTKNTRI